MNIDVHCGCGAATARMARERAMMVFTNIIVIAVSQLVEEDRTIE
jgi:hypothetical protein